MVIVAAACSVSEPRNGFSAAEATRGTTPSGSSVGDPSDAGSGGAALDESSASAPADVNDAVPEAESTSGAAPADAGGSGATPSGGSGSGAGSGGSGGSGGSSAVGVTGDSVTVSFIAGFGGAYGPVIEQTYAGFETWLDDVNARGGVHGRQVRIKKVDHKETAEGGVAACQETLQNGSFFAIIGEGQGDANVTAADCLDKRGFVHAAFVGAPNPSWKNSYYMIPSSIDQGRSLGSFVKNVLGDGDKKLGVFHLAAPVYSLGKDAYAAEAKRLGMDVVAVEQIEPNQGSFTSQLVRMRDAGVENIAIVATIEAIGILRDARVMSYAPKFTGIVWQFDFITQTARDTAKGATGLRYSVTVDTAAFKQFQQKAAEQGRSGATDGEALLFYGYGLLLEKILDSAGPQPTRDSLRLGIESIKGYDNGILPPITWGPGDFVGSEASFPAKCCTPDYAWASMGPPRREF